ncbi:MAG: RNA-binding transcriptional accessory protein [Tissierellia bacterium]|nr:Tex family protein [Bacillota bacterium]NLL23088.1 RNA-binding transcriptional accessory protein [Tissierellia bacterium]
MDIYKQIAKELGISQKQVADTIVLLDEGNTIPFISRYRKEVTGDLSDTQLRDLDARLTYLRSLEERRDDVLRLMEELGVLTEEHRLALEKATSLQAIEDIYRPYRPKKRTRGMVAREKGLKPLAEFLLAAPVSEQEIEAYLAEFLPTLETELAAEEALFGAQDIIAEDMSDDIKNRKLIRDDAVRRGVMESSLKGEDAGNYSMYAEFSEKIRNLKAHNILALFRGEKEDVLRLKIVLSDDYNVESIARGYLQKDSAANVYIQEAVEDGYKRLLLPSIETEIRNALKEMADEESIKVFSTNLEPYLMQPPLKDSVVLGWDPGYRTGCKLAVINELGEVLDHATVFPTKPREDIDGSIRVLRSLIRGYGVHVIAIGNGTASRESEQFVVDFIRNEGVNVQYTIVNESGASIYSASPLGNEEFPNLDVTVRGAISIARRLQDPLAELVKIEPKHIGVGQYQHDVNQKQLSSALEGVVENCVNRVGVNVNQASRSLLSYVSGITPSIAKNILAHKDQIGGFTSRKEILDVKGVGPKTFEQCAGFLRIPESSDPLDNTAVHPESYEIAREYMNQDLRRLDVKKEASLAGVGELTLKDIFEELSKPGRDPRDELPGVLFRKDVLSIDDLEIGMELQGTVRNVVAFGAFVDIGIKNDGLVHISQLADRYVKDPSEVVKVSDIVKVRIIGVDKERGKVSLSMRSPSRN